MGRAFREALGHGNQGAGTPHIVLALLSEPSVAADVLLESGITYDEVVARFCGERIKIIPDGSQQRDPGPGTGLRMNPDGIRVEGRAQGLALAAGVAEPRPEDWLVALLYSADGMGFPAVLQLLGISRPALVESMRRRGIRIPDVDLPPLTKPTVVRRA